VRRRIGLALLLAAAGCSQMGSSEGWLAGAGEAWTILCLELQGEGSEATAREIADVLRRTKGIEPELVRVQMDREGARIYYGDYRRRVKASTRERSIPRRMRADLRLLKELADSEGTRFFLHARTVPAPNPDVGPADWDLRRAAGSYTLQVAVYFNDAELHNRKLAAVEKARQLRGQGLEAYYYHGQTRSIVTVGTFGEEAVVDREGRVRHVERGGERQQVVHRYSDEVEALQRRAECMYNLTNDGIWYNLDSNGRRVPVRSMLVRIPREEPRP